jgi:hypothetical protein
MKRPHSSNNSSPFGIVIAVAFQSTFHLEMYRNNVFLFFFKFIFDISISKQSKNTKKINLKQIKKIYFLKALLKYKNKRAFNS